MSPENNIGLNTKMTMKQIHRKIGEGTRIYVYVSCDDKRDERNTGKTRPGKHGNQMTIVDKVKHNYQTWHHLEPIILQQFERKAKEKNCGYQQLTQNMHRDIWNLTKNQLKLRFCFNRGKTERLLQIQKQFQRISWNTDEFLYEKFLHYHRMAKQHSSSHTRNKTRRSISIRNGVWKAWRKRPPRKAAENLNLPQEAV